MRLRIGSYEMEIRAGRYLGYTPAYNSACFKDFSPPKFYNELGEKLDPIFISDANRAHDPYVPSRYIYFDRYNWGLKTHIYTHDLMRKMIGSPDHRYGALTESRTIVPEDYKIFEQHKGLSKEFDHIFTFDDRILNNHENAVFAPFCASYWYGRNNPDNIKDELYKSKSKMISVMSSDKELCHLHTVRKELAIKCKREKIADAYGTFDGSAPVNVDDSLKDYRYSIIIENDETDYFFTEKITNCFISQTIPIYLGARRINEFFNEEGIIRISEKDVDNIDKILSECTEDAYLGRLEAVLDNYERVKEYASPWDYIYVRYLIDR